MERELFLKRLGKNIAKVRIEQEVTQEKLAELCKKQKQSISRIETGQVNPTALSLHEIAVALKVSISKLVEF
jgi:transcriptional regulator with XRE-family HTH domain